MADEDKKKVAPYTIPFTLKDIAPYFTPTALGVPTSDKPAKTPTPKPTTYSDILKSGGGEFRPRTTAQPTASTPVQAPVGIQGSVLDPKIQAALRDHLQSNSASGTWYDRANNNALSLGDLFLGGGGGEAPATPTGPTRTMFIGEQAIQVPINPLPTPKTPQQIAEEQEPLRKTEPPSGWLNAALKAARAGESTYITGAPRPQTAGDLYSKGEIRTDPVTGKTYINTPSGGSIGLPTSAESGAAKTEATTRANLFGAIQKSAGTGVNPIDYGQYSPTTAQLQAKASESQAVADRTQRQGATY